MKRILVFAVAFTCALGSLAAKQLRPVKNEVKFSGKFYFVNQLTEPPKALRPAAPEYPREVRDVSGEADVAYIINEKGHTEEVQLASATDASFGNAAVEAVKQWRFKPGKVNGTVVRVGLIQKITFNPD